MNGKTAVVLINTGTPDSYQVKDVRRYLKQFLGDKRVINLPWLFRKLLVNGIIAPVRGPRSAKLYRQIWTKEGSPLLVNSRLFSDALAARLGSDYQVFMAMRYGNPSLENCIADIAKSTFSKIVAVPLYPQYADSTTGSIVAEFHRLAKKFGIHQKVVFVKPFFATNAFIKAFSDKLTTADANKYDHLIFSFHGLPVKQTEKMHPGLTCEQANCRNDYNLQNSQCYYASCYETARLLSGAAGLGENSYTVSFQSRLGMNWLKPYTDEVLKEKAAEGLKNVLIASPAFVADCLETIYELGIEYAALFKAMGGNELTLVKSLNDDVLWVGGMVDLIRSF
ncbi:MAG TPA: ferrochelatase [Lentimicrobium sp.]|nr:ferrochelatase [Lentimicrobium sp.]